MGWLAAAFFIFGGLGVGYWLYRQNPAASAEINIGTDNTDGGSDSGGGGDGGGD